MTKQYKTHWPVSYTWVL